MTDHIYNNSDWERDEVFKALPGQQITEDIYSDMMNVLPPRDLPRAAITEAWERYRIPVHGGFMMGEPHDSEGGRNRYMAFVSNNFGHGTKCYYIGLFAEDLRLEGEYYRFYDLEDFTGVDPIPVARFADDAKAIQRAADLETSLSRVMYKNGQEVENKKLYQPRFY
jgi:hypothetical protein